MNLIKPYLKPLFIIGLIILLLIPQTSIMSLIQERDAWHTKAMTSIGESWPGKQTVAGPFLKIPYEINSKQKDNEWGWKLKNTRSGELVLLPEQLKVTGNLNSSLRYRGIHKVPVYDTSLEIQSQFTMQPLKALHSSLNDGSSSKSGGSNNKHINWKTPTLFYLVKDQSGITSQPTLLWNKTEIRFLPGLEGSNNNSNNTIGAGATGIGGMYAKLGRLTHDSPTMIKLAFSLNLQGMEQLAFAQTAKDMQVKLESNWPHPGFIGDYLPVKRDIKDSGFTANWRSSAFSNDAEAMLAAAKKGNWSSIMSNTAGISLVQPVDSYHLSERSIKYAQLFIILTFVAMVLFELFKKLRIHPVQYTLTGLELTLFYLLLISLSEHFVFGLAYIIATLASTGLLTIYFIAILKNKKTGVTFGASLLVLYSALYAILQAEDYALLMGSLLVFGVLALFMLTTRNINWYKVLNTTPNPNDPVCMNESQKAER